MYRTGRVGVCLIAAMIYISLTSVKLFVPDWTEEDKAEVDANIAKDIYYNDEDEVSTSIRMVQKGIAYHSPRSTHVSVGVHLTFAFRGASLEALYVHLT